MKRTFCQRILSMLLCVAMLLAYLPAGILRTSAAAGDPYSVVADPETLTRPSAIYGDNTLNAGKVTVGKSVSTTDVTVNGKKITLNGENNFLITISQAAQVMGLSTQSSVPVDVVFVLDTSGSMDDNDRAESLVTAANSAIKTLMQTNEQNRVAVVAFSSEGYGNGTSGDAAANVLSSLAHYTGDAAESHLQWVNSEGSASGNNRSYIAGRDTATITVGQGNNKQTKTVNAFRHGKEGGTNIQAGIVAGAQILTSVTNTTYTDPETNKTVTRIPFLIVISDGQPTFTYDDDTWYDPTVSGDNAADEQGPGSGSYEGNGFIAAMTAAYYKGKITEHYYGSKASGENRCYVYTMGVEISSLTGDNLALAQITLDPKSQTAGDYAGANAASYWNYGNTANDTQKQAFYGWKNYWENYQAGNAFSVRVDQSGQNGQWVWAGEGTPQEYYEVERPRTPQKPSEPRKPNNWASQDRWNQYYTQLEEYEAAMVVYEAELKVYEEELEAYEEWAAWRDENFTFISGAFYTFTADSIASSEKYVNGVGYAGGIAYNDEYFSADSVSQMESIFQKLVTTIQHKAISAPTKVTTSDHNFDGYVNFYDPIGQYMEVKDMKGIVADGYLYQGASFAKYLQAYGTAGANKEFDAQLRKVIKTRMNLSAADERFESEAELDAFIDNLLTAARNSSYQANYTDNSNFDNSFVWWGNAYNSGEEDEHVQLIGFAENDTIDYITDANTQIPADADYVCRSYFFYGEAGGANPNPEHEYLYFVVRVQRELKAPYRQTVVISAPASLLSMEKVLITESFDENNNPVYTASVEKREPARVVYEVGLWDSITPENVSLIVSADYAGQVVNGNGSVNYDAKSGTYNFFTNDWDRSESLDSHHRAMAKATFDAAADNAFYTYQEDTLLVDANGKAITASPAGSSAYYVREYYDWSGSAENAEGQYTAVKKTTLIHVEIPADAELIQKDGNWYIPAGAYTAATLVVNGDDTLKDDPATEAKNDGNKTGTSSIVAHPHRTGGANNSHYTVYLGNNGKLSLVSDPYEPVKDVSVTPVNGAAITDGDGAPVQVGDVLTYTVEVKNVMSEAADITVTDYIPMGTAFVEGSAGSGTAKTGHTKDDSIKPDSNNVLTWVLKDVPANATRYVSFQVTVTKAALSLNVTSNSISNTATVRIGNSPAIQTNTTYNPPYGKTVTGVNGTDIDGKDGYKVGDVLAYHIRVTNNATDADGKPVAADVTVTDVIPAGTTYVEGSADNGGSYANGVITWTFEDMAPGAAKVVSFQVKISADAKGSSTGTQPEAGEITISNSAAIQIENNPVITTNTTQNKVDLGEMVITKTVAAGGDQSKTFTINLTESTGLLSGTYVLDRDGVSQSVVFEKGKASVTIQHGQTLTIKGLPAGVIISVAEDTSALPGWTPTYNTQSVTVTKGAATTVSSVSVTNTYTLQPLTVTVQGVKNMSGAALTGDITFGFVAIPDSGNTQVGDPLSGEVTVTGNGAFTFTMSPKVFTKPGVYKYTITEINGGVLGVDYDPTAHVLEINVIDNGDGTMRAEAKLNNGVFNLANGAVPFSNTYTPEETQLVITADKTLTGRNLTAGAFSFQLTDGTNTYKGINDANGNIVFQAITYTKTGTYNYTLSEVIPNPKAEGVTYDTKTYSVVVVVEDVNGQLVPTVTVDGTKKTVTNGIVDTGVTFVNTFVPNDVPLKLTARKTLKVYDPASGTYKDTAPEAGKFRFQIVDQANNSVAIGTNDAEGNIAFETFYFSADMLKDVSPDAGGNKTKAFTYTISEVVPQLAKDPNMKYDLLGRQIQVLLTHTADGKLTVSVNGDADGDVDLTADANFINYGNPSTVTVTPTGNKSTKGENLPAGLRFSFKVLPVGGTVDAATGTSDATRGGQNSETTSITFGSLTYTHENLGDAASAVYDYWIMESNASAGDVTGSNGVTYDATRYLYRVTLSRDQNTGRLIATEQYFALKSGGNKETVADYTVEVSGANVSFTNTYAAKAHINLTASKKLTGRTPGLAAGEFDFVLQRLNTAGVIIDASHITGTNDGSGLVRFATLNYSNEMLDEAYKHDDGAFYFSYLLSEIQPKDTAIPSVTYDQNKYIVTVKVTQDNSNGMTATLAGVSKAVQSGDTYTPGAAVTGFTAEGDTKVTFENTYKAVEGDVVKYQIRKDLEGRDVRPGEFEFGLYLNGTLVDVTTNDENGIVTFSRTIPATAGAYADTYEMVIKESKGSVAGVTYSTQEYTIYVKITDNGQGKIEATVHLTKDGPALPEDATGMVDLTKEIVFENTYEAHDTTYTPAGKKELTGRTQIAGEFSFQAQLIHNGAPVTNGAVYKGINDAAGNILFETITFTDKGTYIYKISELPGSAVGMKYDINTYYYLKVEVTDDGSGYLKATAGYYANEACTTAANVVFKNTYAPVTVPVELVGHKTLTGRELHDKEFSFLVYKEGSTTPIASGNNDANGNIKFSSFNITAEDMKDGNGNFVTSRTFTYKIVESDNKLPGVKYAEPVTVTVTVTDTNGVLTATVNYPDGESAKFVNTYTPNSVEVPLVAYKTLTGKNMQAFTFELQTPGGKIIPATNDHSGIITFQNLQFTAADMVDESGNKVMEKDFVYKLTEKAGDMAGMDYDDTVYTVTVTVTDDGNGHLTAKAVYKAGEKMVDVVRFTNTYTPPALELDLEGVKTITDAQGNVLTGTSYPLNGFEFELYDAEGKLVTSAVSDQQGGIKFKDLRFTAAGEYRFTVSEKSTSRPGYTTDSTIWCVHIMVAYNRDTGVLYKENVYIHTAPENHDGILAQADAALEFVNVYDPADVSLTLKGLKKLDGRELREHEFTFYMVDKVTNLRAAESRNHGSGEISFHLTYSKAGTYTYTVFENIPAEQDQLGGVTYTTKTHEVTVEVTDDGTGALKAKVGTITVLGSGDVDLTDTVIFVNTYKPGAARLELEAWKYLDGKILDDKAFTFELLNKNDPSEKYTAANTAIGKILFEELVFTAEDMVDGDGNKVMEKVFEYTLAEVKGNAPGVTYDDEVYTVVVTVTDDGNGQLSAVAQYIDSDGNQEVIPTFHNRYQAKPVTYTPKVRKIFEGGQMRPFDFVLSGKGFQSQTKRNDGDGNVTFDALTFTSAGTYTFTVAEQVNENLEDIKWDTNVYTLTVKVADPGNGQLVIDDITVTSVHGRTDLVFRNVHEDLIAKKDVFVEQDPAVSIDGKVVEMGTVLTYVVSYKNYSGKAEDVTITDKIPQYTTYVDGSADNGGILADNTLTWTFTNVAPDAVITVSFDVEVTGHGVNVENQAQVLEGTNLYKTNTVTTDSIDPIPKTGDTTNVAGLIGMTGFGALGMVVMLAVLLLDRKKNEQ